MEFRRNGITQRRRRVLFDESLAAASQSSPSTRQIRLAVEPKHSYSAAAQPEQQARITDLVPLSIWKICGIGASALLVIAGLETAFAWLPAITASTGISAADLSAIDLTNPASLGVWFSSLTLFAAALLCVLVYRVRRHRIDDYRGRYRIWLPAAAMLVAANIDSATGLSKALIALALYGGGAMISSDPLVWQAGLYSLACLFFGVQFVLDTHRSRGAISGFALCCVLYVLAACMLSPLAASVAPTIRIMLYSTALMSGHVFLLGAIGMFARYVLLDAQGKLVVRPPREKRVKKKIEAKVEVKEEAASPTTRKKPATKKADAATTQAEKPKAPPTPEPAAKPNPAQPPTVAVEANDDEAFDEQEDNGKPLSKAEKRRQRKQRKQNRNAA